MLLSYQNRKDVRNCFLDSAEYIDCSLFSYFFLAKFSYLLFKHSLPGIQLYHLQEVKK